MDIDAGRLKVCADNLAKRLSSPADIQIVEVCQRVGFFFCSEIRRNDRAARQFSGFLGAEDALVFGLIGLRVLKVVIVVRAENERAVGPDGTGILPGSNHIAGVNGHQHRQSGRFMQGGRCGIALGKQHRLAVLWRAQGKPVSGFFTVLQDPGIFPARKWNALVRANLPLRIAERNDQFLFVVDTYPRRGLHALAGQIGVCHSLLVPRNIAGGVIGLVVVLLRQCAGVVLTGLLGVRAKVEPRKRVHLLAP